MTAYLSVGGDRDHVGLRADGDLLALEDGDRRRLLTRRPGVEEDEVTGVGLDGSLVGDDPESVGSDRDRVGDALRGDRELLGDGRGIGVVEHAHRARLRVDDVELVVERQVRAVAVRLHDLGTGGVEDAGLVRAERR